MGAVPCSRNDVGVGAAKMCALRACDSQFAPFSAERKRQGRRALPETADDVVPHAEGDAELPGTQRKTASAVLSSRLRPPRWQAMPVRLSCTVARLWLVPWATRDSRHMTGPFSSGSATDPCCARRRPIAPRPPRGRRGSHPRSGDSVSIIWRSPGSYDGPGPPGACPAVLAHFGQEGPWDGRDVLAWGVCHRTRCQIGSGVPRTRQAATSVAALLGGCAPVTA